MEESGQPHIPSALPSKKEPPPPDSTRWIRGWLKPTAGMDVVALSLLGIEPWQSTPQPVEVAYVYTQNPIHSEQWRNSTRGFTGIQQAMNV